MSRQIFRSKKTKVLSLAERTKKFGNYELIVPDLSFRPIQLCVPKHIARPNYSDIPAIGSVIHIHDQNEIKSIRQSCQLAKHILDFACKTAEEGMSTLELDKIVFEEITKNGAYPSPLDYHGFPNAICTSVNNVICHGIPDNRKLKTGDLLNIDVTVFYSGYHGDTSKTVAIGNVDDKGLHLMETTLNALKAGIDKVGPNKPLNLIGRVIEEIGSKNGYSIDKQFCGHGIGKLFHQAPLIMHYDNPDDTLLEPGMIFTIEPIFNQGSDGFVKWPDAWTAVTVDGARSAQFEHTVLVTDDGVEVLTG
ncbi:Methionine aminopeptidase 1D, mitochondrial [Boothiomyces macroporosus]|uniref:Methionine aminopeptidase n=1 Tax=Boothiomyces macroporosus TaxID=261099 RepID=A0AAD5YA54_9FUNG|nr:Methionine aminopeptidase 1D, mitochondrial [Boothiomyces macroporosus]